MSADLRQLISETTDLAALRQQAIREGMRPLRISGAQKIAAGITSLSEVQRVSPSAQRGG
jgi:general secretion pathway protein E